MKFVKVSILVAAVVSVVCVAVLSEARQAGKVYQIGFLRTGSRSGPEPVRCRLDAAEKDCAPSTAAHIAFRQRLTELGYVLGQDYLIEYRSARGNRKRFPDLAAELARLEVDVIVTTGAPPAIRAAQRGTRTIAIIMAGVTVDPVAAGFVKSVGRPGGNISGLAERQFELHGKRLEILNEAFPQISRVVLLVPRPPDAASNATLSVMQQSTLLETASASHGLDIEIRTVVAGPRYRVDTVLTAISEGHPDALLVPGTSFTNRHMARMIEFAASRGLPAIYA